MWGGDNADLIEEKATPVDTSGILYKLGEFTKLSLSQIKATEFIDETANLLTSTLPISDLIICELSAIKSNLVVRVARGKFLYLRHVSELSISEYNKNVENVFIVDKENKNRISVMDPILRDFPNSKTAIAKVPGALRPWGFIIVCTMNEQNLSADEVSLLGIVANTLAGFLRQNNSNDQNLLLDNDTASKKNIDIQKNVEKSQKVYSFFQSEGGLDRQLATQLLGDEILPITAKTHHFLLNSSLLGVYVTVGGIITRCNHRFAEMFEYTEDELLGKNLEEIFRAREKNNSRYCMLAFMNKKNYEGVRIVNTDKEWNVNLGEMCGKHYR